MNDFVVICSALQRWNLIRIVHGNDAHVLVTLVFLQAHVFRTVHVTDAVHLVGDGLRAICAGSSLHRG